MLLFVEMCWFVGLVLLLEATNGARTNFLILFVDDLKPQVGAYGDHVALTPSIDDVLNRGLRFENMHSQKAECGPSRSSFISGKRNDAIKIWDFEPTFRNSNSRLMTFPGMLRQSGYRTEGVGKIIDNRNFNDNGFEMPDACGNPSDVYCSWDDYISPKLMFERPSVCGGEVALRWPEFPENEIQFDKKMHLLYEFNSSEAHRHVDSCVARVGMERLEALSKDAKDKSVPFLLAVGFLKPHMPWTAPHRDFEPFRKIPDSALTVPPEISAGLDMNDFWTDHSSSWTKVNGNDELENYDDYMLYSSDDRARAYYASTKFMDSQLGRVMEVFDNKIDSEVRDNTMIIFLGDHGFHLGEFGLWGKKTVLEHSTRVPFGIVPPKTYVDSFPPGTVKGIGSFTTAPTDLVDVYPTILDMADVGLPDSRVAGTSLLPLLLNPDGYIRSASISQYESYRDSSYMAYSVRTRYHRIIGYLKLNKKSGDTSGSPRNLELYKYLTPGNFEGKDVIDDPDFVSVKSQMLKLFTDKRDRDWEHVLGKKPFDHDMKFN